MTFDLLIEGYFAKPPLMELQIQIKFENGISELDVELDNFQKPVYINC